MSFLKTHPRAVNKKTPDIIFSSLVIDPNSISISVRIFIALPVSEKLIGNKNLVKTIHIIGKEINNYNFDSTSIKPVIDKNSIRCTVIYIDNFGNVVTNIQKQLFQNTVGDKKFKIFHGSDTDSINKISQVYNDVSIAEKLAIFDMNDYLQIAINKGNASSLLGLKVFLKYF